jgi:hypothetical protein
MGSNSKVVISSKIYSRYPSLHRDRFFKKALSQFAKNPSDYKKRFAALNSDPSLRDAAVEEDAFHAYMKYHNISYDDLLGDDL